MGKKGDIKDWEEMSKKWLQIIYKLIEKPEKKEFKEAAELAVKTQKLLNKCEYPLDQALVNDLRNQIATILSSTDYVVNNVPKGNYYSVMPDYLTHLTRLVLLIAKVIQNIWSQKHGVFFQYVPPEASVYLSTGQNFFRSQQVGQQQMPQQYGTQAPLPQTQQVMPTAPTTPAPGMQRPGMPGYGPSQIQTVYPQPTYPPQYYYSKAYKYAYWQPKSSTGKKLALMGLLTFLPAFLGYMRYKSARGGLTPHDVSLMKMLIDKFNSLSQGVSIPGVDIDSVRKSLNDIGAKLSSMDMNSLQREIANVLESIGNTVITSSQAAANWLQTNVPKLVNEIQDAIRNGQISAPDLNDVMLSLKNVGVLVGDQLKNLPTVINNSVQQLESFVRANAPQLMEAGAKAMAMAGQAVRNVMVGLGGVRVPSPDQVDFSALSNMANDAIKQMDSLLKEAGKGLKKLLDSFL